MTQVIQKRHGRWQLLIKGHCPYDDIKLQPDGKVFACPKCDYYITPKKLVEYLRDPNSHVRVHMSAKDAKRITKALAP